ncbi:NAD-binding protein [Devosia ginsengisoli]|uniref:NAD-binding protein n=1 Tax=Devosia ginsengisoli TaxID=400770 RepID=UPI001FE8FA19|nr:NAD-binding protein [Devosia ginsengisoli]
MDHGVRLLRRKDADVSQAVKAILEADGIEVLLSADVKQVRGRSGEVMAVVQAAMLGQLPYVMPFSPIRRWPRA